MKGGQSFPPLLFSGCNCTSRVSFGGPHTPTHLLIYAGPRSFLRKQLGVWTHTGMSGDIEGSSWKPQGSEQIQDTGTEEQIGMALQRGGQHQLSLLSPAFPGPRRSSVEKRPCKCPVTGTITAWGSSCFSGATQGERSLFLPNW